MRIRNMLIAILLSGMVATAQAGIIATKRGALMDSTADQTITVPTQVIKYNITGVLVTNCTGVLSLAVGGIYTGTGKTGAVVSGLQAYSSLTSTTLALNTTLAAGVISTAYTAHPLYLSLSVAGASGARCDFYVMGEDLS